MTENKRNIRWNNTERFGYNILLEVKLNWMHVFVRIWRIEALALLARARVSVCVCLHLFSHVKCMRCASAIDDKNLMECFVLAAWEIEIETYIVHAHKFCVPALQAQQHPIFIDRLTGASAHVSLNAFVCRSLTIIGFRDDHNFLPCIRASGTRRRTRPGGRQHSRQHSDATGKWKTEIYEQSHIIDGEKDGDNVKDDGKNAQIPPPNCRPWNEMYKNFITCNFTRLSASSRQKERIEICALFLQI